MSFKQHRTRYYASGNQYYELLITPIIIPVTLVSLPPSPVPEPLGDNDVSYSMGKCVQRP